MSFGILQNIVTMATFQELNTCRWDRNPGIFGDKVMDRLGVLLAWLLLKTPVTANQITIIAIVLGAAGLVLVSQSSLWGYLLLLAFGVADYTDGVVARYRRMTSLLGRYYDDLSHFIMPLLFLAVSISVFQQTTDVSILYLGITATILYFAVDINTKLPTFIIGTKRKQMYVDADPKNNGKKSIVHIALLINKNITFPVHQVLFFFVASMISGLLIHWLLLIMIIVFVMTFLVQIIFYRRIIRQAESTRKMEKEKNKSSLSQED